MMAMASTTQHLLALLIIIATVFTVNFCFETRHLGDDELEKRDDGREPIERVFVSAKFGRDAKFADEIETYRDLVEATGLFESEKIHTYAEFPDWILNETRWTEHLRFLEPGNHPSRVGGGYWFWKSVLIDHHLDELDDGDFLVYSDSDLLNHFNWTSRLLQSMQERSANLALYETQYLERQYSKRDIYEEFCDGMDPASDESLQNAGGFVVIRKTPNSTRFVSDWMKGVENVELINNSPSKRLPNAPDFKAHRHDQSVLNALLRCKYHSNGKDVFPGTNIDRSKTLDQGNVLTATWNVHTYRV